MSKPSKKAISLALAAAMLLSACGNTIASETPSTEPSTPSAPSEAPAVKSEPLKNLAISERAANELESLIIMHTQTTAVSDVLTNLYDGLLEVNNEGKSLNVWLKNGAQKTVVKLGPSNSVRMPAGLTTKVMSKQIVPLMTLRPVWNGL